MTYVEQIQKRGAMKALAFCAYVDIKQLKEISWSVSDSIKELNCHIKDGFICDNISTLKIPISRKNTVFKGQKG